MPEDLIRGIVIQKIYIRIKQLNVDLLIEQFNNKNFWVQIGNENENEKKNYLNLLSYLKTIKLTIDKYLKILNNYLT